MWFHLRDFGADPSFHRQHGQWRCRIPRPPVDRMEYLLFGVDSDGHGFMSTDPANPHTSRGVFGPHSVLEFPGYRAPRWLGQPIRAGTTEPVLRMSGGSPGCSRRCGRGTAPELSGGELSVQGLCPG